MTSSSKKVTSRKLLASAGALSVVAGSLGTIPAAFANAPTEQLGGGARQEAQQPAQQQQQQPAQQQGQANQQQQPAQQQQQQGQTGNQQQGQSQAEQSKDLAGQYQSSQSAYSAKNNKAWKTYSSYDSYRAGCVTRVNADTQQVEATVQLPGATQGSSSYSIAIDDVNGTVWVVNTEKSTVTVYDQNTMKELWTSNGAVQGAQGQSSFQAREIKIDQDSGKAYISSYGYVTVIDLQTRAVVKTIDLKTSTGQFDIVGNMSFSGGKLFAYGQNSGALIIVNTVTLQVESASQSSGASQQPNGGASSTPTVNNNQADPNKGGNQANPNQGGNNVVGEVDVHTYDDGAKVYIPEQWQVGQPLKIRGEGFKTQDGTSGSVIGVKLNGGSLAPTQDATFEGKKGNSAGVWLYIQADANGNFTAELPFPSADKVKGGAAPNVGDEVSVNLLTGSMKKGDTPRGGEANDVTIVAGGGNNAGGNNAGGGDNAKAGANQGGGNNAGGNVNAGDNAKAGGNNAGGGDNAKAGANQGGGNNAGDNAKAGGNANAADNANAGANQGGNQADPGNNAGANDPAQVAVEETVHTYDDGAKVYIPKNWQVGQSLKIRGEGFKTQDGTSGSVIAVKLNGGSLAPAQDATFEGKKGNSAGVWLYIQADANGNFTAEIPFPSADKVKGDAPKVGEKVAINLLSGSMKKGDNARGGEAAEVTITEGGANAGGNANAGDNANANANAGGNANANAGGNANANAGADANANGAAKGDANGIAAAKDNDHDSAVTGDSTTTSGGSTGTTSGEARGSGSATTAATKSSSRTLANTGASGMWVALGAGTAALVAGSVMVARRRTSA